MIYLIISYFYKKDVDILPDRCSQIFFCPPVLLKPGPLWEGLHPFYPVPSFGSPMALSLTQPKP